MEGLFSPCCAVSNHLKLPYYGFHASAEVFRRGNIEDAPIPRLAPDDLAAYVQIRLFFHLMAVFFADLYREDDFILNGQMPKAVIVDVTIISRVILKWHDRMSQSPQETRRRIYTDLERVLNSAQSRCDQMDFAVTSQSSLMDSYNLGLALLSVRVLMDYLRFILSEALRNDPTENFAVVDYHMRPLSPGSQDTLTACILLDLFAKAGWCPSRARILCQSCTYNQATSLSQVTQEQGSRSHDLCSQSQRCVAHNLSVQEENTYTQEHGHQSQCKKLGCKSFNSRDKLFRIIQAGKVPMISFNLHGPDLDLRITEYDGVRQYTAISHVWSDGLGNPKSNELQMCKLHNLREILVNAQGLRLSRMHPMERRALKETQRMLNPFSWRRLNFWIDTLCIPNDKTRPDLKQKAIRHITPIFQGANEILILDTDLKKYSPRTCRSDWASAFDEEVIARLIASKWIGRAWTFEEGCLARDCELNVDNKIVRLADLMRCDNDWFAKQVDKIWRRETTVDFTALFRMSLRPLLNGVFNEQRKQAIRTGSRYERRKGREVFENSGSMQFVNAWNELLQRSATNERDRVLIFGNILDIDATSLPRDETMLPTIIQSCRLVPVSLMFNTRLKSSENESSGSSLIPTDIVGDKLVDSGTMTWNERDKRWQMDQHGIQNLICLELTDSIPSTETRFCVFDAKRQSTYVVNVRESDRLTGQRGVSTYIIIDPSTGTHSINGYKGRGAKYTALCWNGGKVSLKFDQAITAWSEVQWRRNNTGDCSSLKTYISRDCLASGLEIDWGGFYTQTKKNFTANGLGHTGRNDYRALKQRQLLPAESRHATIRRHVRLMFVPAILVTIVAFGFVVVFSTITGHESTTTAIVDVSVMVANFLIQMVVFRLWRWHRKAKHARWIRSFCDV